MENYKKYVPAIIEDLNPMEVWWPVEGNIYHKGKLVLHIQIGHYEVSNIGRVRCLNYGGIKGNVQVLKLHNEHGTTMPDNDWKSVRIFGKIVRVHTLIALVFLGERPDGYEVDHINFRRDDNRPENLRYLPKGENGGRHSAKGKQNHKEAMDKLWNDEFRKQMSDTFSLRWETDEGFRKRHSERLVKRWETNEHFRNNIINAGKEANHKSVLEIDGTTGDVINVWYSMSEASRETGVDFKKISLCCIGKRNTAGGRIWAVYDTFGTDEYYEKLEKDMLVFSKGLGKAKHVLQLDMQDNVIAEYSSQHEASRQTGIRQSSINLCCRGKYKTAGGKKWKYKNEEEGN